MSIRLRRPQPLEGVLEVPGSKSLTNRALVLAALSPRPVTLTGCLVADDTVLMERALANCDVRITHPSQTTRVVEGPLGGSAQTLDVGTAGTAARFLTAVLAAGSAGATLDGSARMRERPMALLIEALRQQGATIHCAGRPNALPLSIPPGGSGLLGGEIRLERPASSQFVSALALAALRADAPTRIVLEQGTPARPYVDMTLAAIRAFGGEAMCSANDENVVEVKPGLAGTDAYAVECDASAASYFLAMAAIYGDSVTILGLGRSSLQGDAGFCHALGKMGAVVNQDETQTTVRRADLRGATLDFTDTPDMTLTAAVLALFAEGTTEIRGVEVLRHHECDRLAAATTELRKLGASVTEHPDGLTITPAAARPRTGVAIDTYDDHRMAMAFALVGDVEINEPECVTKTFPEYFKVLGGLGMLAPRP